MVRYQCIESTELIHCSAKDLTNIVSARHISRAYKTTHFVSQLLERFRTTPGYNDFGSLIDGQMSGDSIANTGAGSGDYDRSPM